MKIKNKCLVFTLLFPMWVLLIQINDNIAICAVPFLIISIITIMHYRQELSLLLAITFGYLLWQYLELALNIPLQNNLLNKEWIVVISRFALLGYILPFVVWQFISKSNTNYFSVGNFREKIKMPFIWRGMQENVTRVCVVFSLICLLFAGVFSIFNMLTIHVLLAGITFSIINSTLEEFLWRGFILNRTVDLMGEKMGLVAMSIAFGFYHYSLGFSIPICLVFSLGGIYFGGVTIRSKGLFLPVVMHICMNILFVAIGIIF